jgi:hypothetical protein
MVGMRRRGRADGGGRPPVLWHHRDFLLLWSGQAVSEIGSAVTVLALPLTAVVVLHASAFAVGVLAELLGRMNAAVRWIVWGTLPVGSLLGGALGTVPGIRPALWLAAAGVAAAGLWVFFSPLRHMRDVPRLAGPQPRPAALTPP